MCIRDSLYRGCELRIFLYAPDPVWTAKIEADVLEFEGRLDTFRRDGVVDWYPAFSTNDAATMYERSEPEQVIDLNTDTSEKVLELIDARRAQKTVKSLIDKLQGEIMDEMGNHELAVVYEDGRAVASVKWGMTSGRKYKATEERYTPPKRSKTLSITEFNE